MVSGAGLLATGVAYLLALFGLAEYVDRGGVARRISRHPLVASMTLGVYATSWTYYGSAGFARGQGLRFLTIYLGVTIACALTPFIWEPLLRLVRAQSLGSPADLLAYRFRHPWTGPLVTLFALAGSLPYLAQQIQAVSGAVSALTGIDRSHWVGFGFCLVLALFSALFGARHLGGRQRHDGLAAAIAVESCVKLLALACVGLFATFGVLGGSAGIDRYLAAHPGALEALQAPAREGPWGTLLLLSGSAAYLLPRQFHVAFAESPGPRALRTASWALPAFLLLLNLPIVPILWAGTELAPAGDPDLSVLAVARASGSAWLPTLAFVGGLSAASSMVIVTSLATASMCLNHLVLPLFPPRPERDLYRWLLAARRWLVTVVVLAGFAFFVLLEHRQELAQLGLISFVAVAQFLPGVLALVFWPRASSAGFLWGLCGGISVWAVLLIWPLFRSVGGDATLVMLVGSHLGMGDATLAAATFLSLATNVVLFVGVTVAWGGSAEDEIAARDCQRPLAVWRLGAESPREIIERLVPVLGPEAAQAEVERARRRLGLDLDERRPAQLGRLRAELERSLSGLMGPSVGRGVLEEALSDSPEPSGALADRLLALELQLGDARVPLQGAAADQEEIRRYLRSVLEELPLGVCSTGPIGEVVIWNEALARLSGLDADRVVGLALSQVPEPWGALLAREIAEAGAHAHEERIALADRTLSVLVQRTRLEGPAGRVVVVQDLTQRRLLEAQVAHQDRLASVGRFAAGFAHEVGNPLTGIAMVAQNLRVEQPDGDVSERAGLILEQTARIDRIVRTLMAYARSDAPRAEAHETTQFPLAQTLKEAVGLVRLSKRGRDLQIETRCAPELQVRGNAQRLAQVWVNLLANACDASPEGASVRIAVEAREASLEVQVADMGQGIPEELHARIFEPFFTTKSPGEGTGLGLALALSIVREHGGTIGLESRVGKGTTFTVTLPRAAG